MRFWCGFGASRAAADGTGAIKGHARLREVFEGPCVWSPLKLLLVLSFWGPSCRAPKRYFCWPCRAPKSRFGGVVGGPGPPKAAAPEDSQQVLGPFTCLGELLAESPRGWLWRPRGGPFLVGGL